MADTSVDMQKPRIILASQSPRRKEILEEAGVDFEIRKPSTPVDESLDADMLVMPEEYAKKLAEKKAGAVVQDLLAAPPVGLFAIIGADTIVTKGGEIFGKPRNLDDAKRMLRTLSGSTHEVITALSVWMLAAQSDEDISLAYRTFVDKSKVRFKPLTDEEIADYLRKGESFDKAGAYAIQGEGSNLVEEYEGNIDTIIGLPLKRLQQEFPDLIG